MYPQLPFPFSQDIYEPRERGTVVGIYYAAPLLGPAIGPLIGGVATQLFSWRATFFFLVIFAGLSLLSFLFFKDTFRRERSLTYQGALRRATNERDAKLRLEEEKTMRRKQDSSSKDEKRQSDLEAAPNADQPQPTLADVRLSLGDIIPVRPVVSVLRRTNNVMVLFPSGQCLPFVSLFI
jgi:MFS family permease